MNIVHQRTLLLWVLLGWLISGGFGHAVEPSSTAEPYDVVVVGGTPAGIACSVRAAREGLRVLLVNRTEHLGGFMSSGASGWEAPYDGRRSVLYSEMLDRIAAYYGDHYGEGSRQQVLARPSQTSRGHIDRPKVEPRVAELVFDQMVAGEERVTVLKGFIPEAVDRSGSLLTALTLKAFRGTDRVTVAARTFVDATYEGDLLALTGVPYEVGRESRDTYGESHAGVVFTPLRKRAEGQRGWPVAASDGALNIRYNPHARGDPILPESTGEADASVMAYNYRFILTNAPENLVEVPKPADYDRERYRGKRLVSIVWDVPNQKVAWNGGRLVGPQNDYPEGDWERREEIERESLDYALGLLWYILNDAAAPADQRERWKGWGLAKDEFADNHHIPYEIYVREARRLTGRYVFTQHDGVLHAEHGRTPLHADSVAITDWPIDSVACLPDEIAPGIMDGQVFMAEESRPAQVPYRSLLPQSVDNLLVPVCLSSSHVGWGCLRLEPVWVQTGEAAGWAAVLAQADGVTPAKLNPEHLIVQLAEARHAISFLNDLELLEGGDDAIAANYFGTKGFFADYDARLDEPLSSAVAALWEEGLNQLETGTLDPNALATKIDEVSSIADDSIGVTRGQALVELWERRKLSR